MPQAATLDRAPANLLSFFAGMVSQTRRARWIVIGWLMGQAASLAASPIAFCHASADAASATACTCAHAANQPCPMHRHAAAPRPASNCACRSTTNPDVATLAALLGPSAAVMPAAASSAVVAPVSLLPRASIRVPFEVVIPPDGPPPRS